MKIRVVNKPEDEGQFVELLTVPRRYRAGRWQTTLSVGWSGLRRLVFGVDVDLTCLNTALVLFSFGPFYIALVSEK